MALNPKAVNCRAGPENLIYVCGSTDFTRKMESMSCIQKDGNSVHQCVWVLDWCHHLHIQLGCAYPV